MQDQAKISLSAFELELVTNPQWILTKNGVIQKVYTLFGSVSEAYKLTPGLQSLPPVITNLSPKISKGENYKGLPYVMLDFPRCFGKDDVFAIRSFFWWGHYFSITLHLKGKYLVQFSPSLLKAIDKHGFHDWYINESNEEWSHDVKSSMVKLKPNAVLTDRVILKLSNKIDLEQWDQAAEFYKEQFNLLMNMLRN